MERDEMHREPGAAFEALIEAFAAEAPLPAGGAAAVVALSMGTALGAKVFGISGLVAARGEMLAALKDVLPHFDGDCAAFASVFDARRRTRSDPERAGALERAWAEATRRPVEVARFAARLDLLLARHEGEVKRAVHGDLQAARRLVRVGGEIAAGNARENAARLDPETARGLLDHLP